LGIDKLKKIDRAKARDCNIRKYARLALESWGLAKQRMNSQLTPLTFTPECIYRGSTTIFKALDSRLLISGRAEEDGCLAKFQAERRMSNKGLVECYKREVRVVTLRTCSYLVFKLK